MKRFGLNNTASAFGLLLVAVSLAWWLIVFSKVMDSGNLGFSQSVVCLGTSSVLCDLAMSLCSASHFLDIRYYSPYLLWFGVAVLSAALLNRLRTS